MTRRPLAAGLAAALAAIVLLGGCAGTPTPTPKTQASLVIAGRTPQDILPADEFGRITAQIPAVYRNSLLRAEAFGRTIYDYDRLAREAGQLIAPGGRAPFSYPPVGWLTERSRAGLRLIFIVKENDKLAAAATVTETDSGLNTRRLTPPLALTPRESILWKARQIAYSTKFKPCSNRYDPVVLPVLVEGANLIYVFLLPASGDPATIYLGGYQRIAVSADGNAVLEDHAFTRGCITLHSEGKATGANVTEILSDTPTAPQVYASLRYGLPIHVETLGNGQFWLVENGRITLAKK